MTGDRDATSLRPSAPKGNRLSAVFDWLFPPRRFRVAFNAAVIAGGLFTVASVLVPSRWQLPLLVPGGISGTVAFVLMRLNR